MTDEEQMADIICEAIQLATAPLVARIKQLESRGTLEDRGTWKHGETYNKGDVVTHHGSAWICRSLHYSVGDDISHTDFRLLVKKGRDATR
jgi:hypothetical protein